MERRLLLALGLSGAFAASAQTEVPWTALPGTPTGEVNTLLPLDNGDLVVAGTFTSVSGLLAANVAIFDGNYLLPLGDGVPGTVNCGIVHEGAIILGGQFNNNDLATWNGTDWVLSTTGGMGAHVTALHVHEGELYAASSFAHISGVSLTVLRFNEDHWDAIGVFNRPVFALGSYNGELIAGGAFVQSVPFASGVPADHVARFDGTTWSQLGAGLDTTVYALETVNGVLYAGGQLYAGDTPTFGLARFTNDTWTTVPGLHDRLTPWSSGFTAIHALDTFNGELLLGGSFKVTNDEVIGMCIGRLGTNDEIEALGHFNNTVRTFAVDGNDLLVGGDFSYVDLELARTVVSADLTTVGIDDAEQVRAHVRPNPATDQVVIAVPEGITISSLLVLGGQGRMVKQAPVRTADGHLSLEVSDLASGMYSVVLISPDGTHQKVCFIKE